MAQSLDPNFHPQQRSESPAGSILRRLFGFWEHEDDLAPEVAPGLEASTAPAPARVGGSASRAFTIWTSEVSPRPSVITRSSTGRLRFSEFNGFTLWMNPPFPPTTQGGNEAIAMAQSSSQAFTLWSLPDVREDLAARWLSEKAETIGRIELPRSRAFCVWVTPLALAAQSGRWVSPPPVEPISLPASRAFSTWTSSAGLAQLAGRWLRSDTPRPIHLVDPRPFTAWTSPAALSALASRWAAASPAPASPVRQLVDPHPFTIWTAAPQAVPQAPPAGSSHPIRLNDPQAHSIWTSVEGLAAGAARWIPHHATAKVAPIPASFTESREQPVAASREFRITPFPSATPRVADSPETDFANQNNMEDNSTKPIQLTDSKAFTLWSTPEHWKTNTIATSSAKRTADSAVESTPAATPASAAPVAAPDEPVAADSPPALETAGAAHDSGDTWKWAFILTLIAGLGIMASQSAAIRSVKDDIDREIASREDVSKKLKFASTSNADLTDQFTAKSALAQTLANEKADLQAAKQEEAKKFNETIEQLKGELATKGSQVGGMEKAIASAKKENETAVQKIVALAKEIEDKGRSLDEAKAALAAATTQAGKLDADLKAQTEAAAKLGTQAEELKAKLAGSSADQQAMSQELSASAAALSATMQRTTMLEKQIAELEKQLAEAEQAPSAAPE